MKKTNFVKRALSFAMAAFIALPSGMGAVRSEAASNSNQYLVFYDETTKTKSFNPTIVEGTSTTLLTNLPEYHYFSAEQPFYITESGTNGQTANESFKLIAGNTASNSYYTVTSIKDLDEKKSVVEYTFDPQYSANLTSGYAEVSYYDANNENAPLRTAQLDITLSSNSYISINENSSLTFSVSENSGKTLEELEFEEVQDNAVGYFKDKYEKQKPSRGKVSGKSVNVGITGKEGDAQALLLNFTIDFSNMGNVVPGPGTQITIKFNKVVIVPIMATVVSREKALDDARLNIQNNPQTPDANTSKEAFVQLANNETFKTLQSSFSVLSQVHYYNIDVDIDWDWKATDPQYQDFIQISTKKGGTKKSVEILQRPEKDFTGQLWFYVTYTYTDTNKNETIKVGATAEEYKKDGTKQVFRGYFDLNFYGTGKTPEVIPVQTFQGQQGSPKPADITEKLDSFPSLINMDVYTGSPSYFEKKYQNKYPTAPYRLTSSIFFGEGRGEAKYAIIEQNSQGGEVEVLLESSAIPYKSGTKIEVSNSYLGIDIMAKTRGQTSLSFKFYNDKNEQMLQSETLKFYVNDNTPSGDGTLKSLDIEAAPSDKYKDIFGQVYPDNLIDYGFDPSENAYRIQVPNCVEKITLIPTLTVNSHAYEMIKISVDGETKEISNSHKSADIPLETALQKNITVTVTAQNGDQNTYTLSITRASQSAEATLSSFEAHSNIDTETNLITAFSSNVYKYEVSVPFSATEMTVTAVPTSAWVIPWQDGGKYHTVEWEVKDGSLKPLSLISRLLSYFQNAETLTERTFILNRPVKNPDDGTYPENAKTVITAVVTAENGVAQRTYELTVNSLPPNTDTLLQSLSVTAITASDEGGNVSTVLPFVNYDFDPETKDYLVRIPYSTSAVKISAQANDEKTSQNLELTSTKYKDVVMSPAEYKPHMPRVFTVKNMNPVSFTEGSDPNLEAFLMELRVTAESEDKTDSPYTIEFQREDPNDDTSLKSLTLTDQNGTAIPEFSFNAQKLEYDITVPFLTTNVTATPVQNYHLSTIKVNDKLLTKTQPSFTTKMLPTGTEYVMTIVVTAEDYSQRTYTINITREDPSDEARLSALTAGSLTLEPKFNPNTLKYNVTIPEGTDGIIVTPTASSPYATITVDKMATESGKPSHKISPLDANSKIHIVVTAQDGKTTKTYVLNVTDENLITKSDNADLYSLAVVTADLNPKFNASVTEYEAYVKEDVYSVDIIPKTANRYADVTVYADSRKIGDYDENYSVSLFDDETEVTVEVVSQDGKVTNEYVVTILRGDEERQGKYAPIDEEDVNFEEADPIRIDITKYPLVSGEVFNTLKTEYPDKSILFTGNDYTLTIKGSDITTLVPNTDYYDLSITFSPPDEEDIWDTITDLDSDNYDLEPVFIHFNYHGTLPGPMKFTISLGTEYRNREMYWYYYNEERERIDYYGYVLTNAKGTFALPLTHMSTYVTVEDKILEAENKVGASMGYDNPGNPESLSSYFNGKKENPNTGAEVK